MQQCMSALLDDGFVAVTKLKGKQRWLTKFGWPVTAVTPHNTQRVDELICDDHRITTEELCRIISISKGNVMTVIQKFVHGGYQEC